MAGLLVGGLLLVGCDPSPTLPPAEPIVPPPPRPPPTLERRVAVGESMFETKGCRACHGEGEPFEALVAPLGVTREFVDGSTLVLMGEARRAYVRESIRDPRARVVAGFGPVMPRIQLSDDEVEALALYLECRSGCEGACWPACDGVDRTAESRGWWSPGVGEVF